MLPSASTRTDSYSICAQGRQPWQYLVCTTCQAHCATCDAAPRAKSISEIHSSLSKAGDNVLWEVVQDQCAGNLPLFPEFFHWLQLSVLPLLPGGCGARLSGLKTCKKEKIQVLINVRRWALDTVPTNTNVLHQALIHKLFCQLKPPNKLYTHLNQALLFRLIAHTSIKNRVLASTRDLFLQFWQRKHKKTVVAMSNLCWRT